MKTTDRFKEIVREAIRRLKENTNYSVGICQHLKYSCTEEEFPQINEFFLENKPKEILSEKWWWTMDEEGHEKRILFLENLINTITEKRYYTPEVEEFYVGFECEILNNADAQQRFVKAVLDKKSLSYITSIKPEAIRVKKLDQQDIEECGWKFYKEMENTYLDEPCLMFHNDELNLMLGFYYKDSRISLATKDPSKNEIFLKTNQDPNRISILKVKNKSEFKKIIRMLDYDGTR